MHNRLKFQTMILRKFCLFIVFICLEVVAHTQNLPCISTLNSAGSSFSSNNHSAVFALGEVVIGSSSTNNNYVVLSIIRPDGKLITNIKDVRHNLVKVKAYPNPVLTSLNLDSDTELLGYKILNSYGQVVSEGNIDSKNEIDVSTLLQGTYLLQVLVKDAGFQAISWITKIDNN